MVQIERWKRFGLGKSLLVVGGLAAGMFAAVGSCDSEKMGAIGAAGARGVAGAAGATGTVGIPGFSPSSPDANFLGSALQSITNGRQTFRFDTFGDEAFWGDALKLHQAIAGSANGGVGPGVSPKTALAVGLKVDADALPAPRRGRAQGGQGRPRRSGRRRSRCCKLERGRRRDGLLRRRRRR